MITPSYPSKFPIPETFWKTQSPPTKIFRTVRKTTFDKFVIHHLMLFSLIQKISETKESPYNFFRYCETKKLSRENRDIPFLSKKNFDKMNFLRNEGFPYEFFRHCEKTNFRQIVIHHLMQFFQSRSFLKQNGPTRNFFGSVRRKTFERKSWYPLLIHKIFGKKNFSEKWRVLLRKLWDCEKNNFRQIRDTPSYAIFFDPEFFWNERVPLRLFSVLWDKKNSWENRDIHFLSIEIFDKRNFLSNEGFPYEIFRYCEKINFRQNRDTPSYAIFPIQKFSETKWSH